MHLSPKNRAWAAVVGAVVLVLLTVVLQQLGRSGPGAPGAASAPQGRTTARAVGPTIGSTAVATPHSTVSTLSPVAVPWVAQSALDSQARQTLALIQAGGPFPYPRNDGVTYHNANRYLAPQRDGYYREYTVPTPGSSSRGARRIIAGQGGDFYYTRDHYDSFSRIRLGS